MSAIHAFNSMSEIAARDALRKCCASERWIGAMLASRPFDSDDALIERSTEVWWSLDAADWREAFAAHPRIGDVESLRAKYSDTRELARSEQAGVDGAPDEIIQELARLNQQYCGTFGDIFIVCATGKTAEQMLSILQDRLSNPADVELRLAAAEQLKITQLRLRKLVS